MEIEDFFFDSRQVTANSLFIAVKGTQVDGHDYIQKALEKGAVAVVCEEFPEETPDNVTYLRVKNSARVSRTVSIFWAWLLLI